MKKFTPHYTCKMPNIIYLKPSGRRTYACWGYRRKLPGRYDVVNKSYSIVRYGFFGALHKAIEIKKFYDEKYECW